jgi:type I restriction enzyme, S subunit
LPRGQRVQDELTSFPYIRVTDFENYSVNLLGLKFITDVAHKQISRYVIYDNDVFISIAGTIGRVGIIPSRLNGANLTENAAKLTDIEGVLPKFLMYYLSSPKSAELISFSTKSTSQPKLALFRIGNLKVKYPFNKKDQQQIVDEIESRFSIIDNLGTVIGASLAKAEKLRKSILKSAFEGRPCLTGKGQL